MPWVTDSEKSKFIDEIIKHQPKAFYLCEKNHIIIRYKAPVVRSQVEEEHSKKINNTPEKMV